MKSSFENSNYTKVLFEVANEDGSIEIESVWALPVDGGYQIDNIPFYAKDIACGDIVGAEPDEDGMLRYVGLVSTSGHSTIRLWFASKVHVAPVRDVLRDMGCASELDLARLLAVDVPPSIPYDSIRAYFDHLESAGVCEYEEACLAQKNSVGEA